MSDKVAEYWKDRRTVRFTATQWCNYGCSYCGQTHDRKAMYKGSPAHFADNRPWQDWALAFRERFSAYRTSFHVTGGEALLDVKNMLPLVQDLVKWVDHIDFDSNATFDPKHYADLDMAKVELMVSFHHDQTTADEFKGQVDRILAAGWHVTTVAIVLMPGKVLELEEFGKHFRERGVPLTLLAYYANLDPYTVEEKALFDRYVPQFYRYTVGASPKGQSCLYPSLGYEVDPDGSLVTSCLRQFGMQHHGDLFEGQLPALETGRYTCPKDSCSCSERFSFISTDHNLSPSPKREKSEKYLELQCRNAS